MAGEIPEGTSDSRTRQYAARDTSPLSIASVRAVWGQVWSSMAVPSRLRLAFVALLLGGGALGLWLNLVRLQVLGTPQTQSVLEARASDPAVTVARRRPIVDRNGHILAIDRATHTLYAHPQLFDEKPYEVAERLAPILNRSVRELYRMLQTASSGIRLVDLLGDTNAAEVRALRLNGLELVEHPTRLYPNNDLAADIVGYVDFDGRGQAGVEYSYRDRLIVGEVSTAPTAVTSGTADDTASASSPNAAAAPPDRDRARTLSEIQYDERTRNRDDLRLQLTIDLRLQRTARRLLADTVREFQAKRGLLMVMDARDGAILASSSYPSYNPNAYFEADVERFKNWALSDIYEPGSTFKPLNIAIALEAGAIEPDDYFNDPGRILIGEWPISNFDYDEVGGRGTIGVTEILRDSSNVGMVEIVRQMSATDYHDWLTRLDVDRVTGIDLPFEARSQLKSREIFDLVPVEPATVAFGQGLAIAPIQLLKLHGILASGGQIVTPHVVRGLVDSEDRIVWTPDFKPPQRVLSSETTQATIAMMEDVVQNGTGKNAQIANYRIAGKTGTSQKIDPNSGGYSDSAIVTSFIGILPVEDPRYVVLAAIDEPQKGRAGGIVAAPVVRQLVEHLIAIEQIPPSGKP